MPAFSALALDLSVLGPLTDHHLYQLCVANKNLRIERTKDGQVVLRSPVASDNSARNLRIAAALFNWNEREGGGIAFDSSGGFLLPDGSMRAPDVAWVAADRWHALTPAQREEFAPLCPDFVVELISKSDRLATLQQKMEEWIANGCRLAWLISPKDERAWVYRADGTVNAVTGFDQSLDGEDVLPGFTLPLEPLR
jgi:Uma2 family endonuclease